MIVCDIVKFQPVPNAVAKETDEKIMQIFRPRFLKMAVTAVTLLKKLLLIHYCT